MSFKRAQKTVSTKTNWFETSVNGGVLLLGVLQEAAGLTPVPYLKQAAGVTLKIIDAVQQLKDNKADFRRLAQDATALIATIFDRYKNSPDQASWPPPEIAQIIYELVGTVEEILSFVVEQVHKNRAIRLMNSKADVGKVKEYRERLQAAVEKFQISSHLNLNESVALILKKLNQQEQQAGSHPTPFEEVSEIQAKIEADRRRKKEMDAKAAEETRRKEIEAKQREVAESVESIRRAEAEAQEHQKVQDEVQRLRTESELLRRQQDLARQQAELDEQRRQLAAGEEARMEYAGRRWSSTTPINADSAGSGSINADDPVVLDQAYKRYEAKEQSYLSTPKPARKGSHSKKSKVEDYEEESEELVNESSDGSSTDEELRKVLRQREEKKRRKAQKAASKKTRPAGQTASSSASSSSSPSTSTPQAQQQPFQQPPVSPPPPQIEEILVAHLARLGINPTANQPYSPPPSQSPPYANPTGYASPQPGHHYSPPPPGLYPYYHTPPMPPFSPHGGYLSPPPGTIMYNSGNYSNNTISNVGNNNSRTVIQSPKPRRATSRRTGN